VRKPKGGRPNRRINDRNPRRIIRVHLEGEVTEKGYLKRIAQQNRDVQIDFGSTGCAPLTLVENARVDVRESSRRNSAIDFDEIWCVFDVDAHPNLNQAREEARQSRIRTAVSNPCFELWLILHAEDLARYTSRRGVQRHATVLGFIVGKSIPHTAWTTLNENYDAAKRRTQSLDAMHAANGSPAGNNPSSGMWQLIDQLQNNISDTSGNNRT